MPQVHKSGHSQVTLLVLDLRNPIHHRLIFNHHHSIFRTFFYQSFTMQFTGIISAALCLAFAMAQQQAATCFDAGDCILSVSHHNPATRLHPNLPQGTQTLPLTENHRVVANAIRLQVNCLGMLKANIFQHCDKDDSDLYLNSAYFPKPTHEH